MVLFNIIFIIAVGVSAHAVAGSLAWIRMRHITCKRLFYTYNTVVLFNIIFIIAVGVSAHAVAGSLAWIRMRHITWTRLACWSLEVVLNMPAQFDSRSQPLSLSVCEN